MKSPNRLVVGIVIIGVLIAAGALLGKILGHKRIDAGVIEVLGVVLVGAMIAAVTLFEKIFGHKRDAAGKSLTEQEEIETSTRFIFWTLRRNRLVLGIIMVGVLIALYACHG
jgi:hypothetical protein